MVTARPTRANFLLSAPSSPPERNTSTRARPGRPEHGQCRVQMQVVQQLEIRCGPKLWGGRGRGLLEGSS